MPTYYEILKVQSTATITEIETALDEQYNQWRRLVTHHDPNVVNQANQALQTLEMIRATLIDLEKRSVYDAAIGVNGPVGGLADPETLLRASVPPIRLASTQRTDQVSPTAAIARLDGWVCAQCQTMNPIKTRFCSKCGQQLGLDCPNCSKLTKASDAYCMECGVNIEEFEHFLEGLDMYMRDNMEIGLAFKPSDDLSVVSRLSHKVDFLHCMGSDKIGFQGETFSEKALENIKFLKKNLPGIVISVDIGVNLENAKTILDAGADRLTVGSGMWKNPDPIGALETFQSLV